MRTQGEPKSKNFEDQTDIDPLQSILRYMLSKHHQEEVLNSGVKRYPEGYEGYLNALFKGLIAKRQLQTDEIGKRFPDTDPYYDKRK